MLSGGKVTHFDRVEWRILPEPNTAANALIKGEVNWLERPHADHIARLHGTRGLTVQKLDPFGWMGMLWFNQRRPLFDNPVLRRAVLMGLDQKEYLQPVMRDYPVLASEWASFCSGWTGLSTANPGGHRPLAGNVPNPQMEALRAAWLEAPDLGARKRVASEKQLLSAQVPARCRSGSVSCRMATNPTSPASPRPRSCRSGVCGGGRAGRPIPRYQSRRVDTPARLP